MKRIITLMVVVAMMAILTACGNTVGDINLEAGQSAIYIQDDGTVSYAVAEQFDKDYYNKKDLETKIKEEIAEYNASSAASVSDAIALNGFDVSDHVATVVLDFSTDYDLLQYMTASNYNNISQERFYIGSIADSKKSSIKGDFVSPDKKETKKGKEIRTLGDDILMVNETYKVQVEGTILYVSDNCTVDEDGIVTTAKEEDGISYIVYNNKTE